MLLPDPEMSRSGCLVAPPGGLVILQPGRMRFGDGSAVRRRTRGRPLTRGRLLVPRSPRRYPGLRSARTALGVHAGEAKLREVITAGGFRHVRRATESPFNMILEARP
jgi:hypothetical protein